MHYIPTPLCGSSSDCCSCLTAGKKSSAGQAVPSVPLFGVAGIIEIVLGLLIIIGLFAGYAAFIASGEMAVAYFIGHFQKSFWPLENQGEPAVLFCFMFFVYGDSGRGDLECRCSTRSGRDPNSRKEAYVEAAAMWRNSKARNLNSTSQLKNSKLLNVMIPAVCIGYSNFEIACNLDI